MQHWVHEVYTQYVCLRIANRESQIGHAASRSWSLLYLKLHLHIVPVSCFWLYLTTVARHAIPQRALSPLERRYVAAAEAIARAPLLPSDRVSWVVYNSRSLGITQATPCMRIDPKCTTRCSGFVPGQRGAARRSCPDTTVWYVWSSPRSASRNA